MTSTTHASRAAGLRAMANDFDDYAADHMGKVIECEQAIEAHYAAGTDHSAACAFAGDIKDHAERMVDQYRSRAAEARRLAAIERLAADDERAAA